MFRKLKSFTVLFSNSLIIHAALTQSEHLILVKWMGEKRVENTAVNETISNTNANFLNLHIDKATKTRRNNFI